MKKPPTDKPKLLVILGPTASGKSDLAVEVARKWSGEVISADSRQVYQHLNIGTGKITKREMRGVPHHLLDVANPKARKQFTVQNFMDLAGAAISDITTRGKLPILCGGTGFYIDAVVNGVVLPDVEQDPKLRAELKKKTTKELLAILSVLDPDRAASVDWHNPYRVIRAIEIAKALGKVPKLKETHAYDVLKIGIETDDEELRLRIHTRLLSRLRKGMLAEAKRLHAAGLSYERMFSLGLEYRYMSLYMRKLISKDEMIETIETRSWQYAKNQRRWFRRDKEIRWFEIEEKKRIINKIEKFIS